METASFSETDAKNLQKWFDTAVNFARVSGTISAVYIAILTILSSSATSADVDVPLFWLLASIVISGLLLLGALYTTVLSLNFYADQYRIERINNMPGRIIGDEAKIYIESITGRKDAKAKAVEGLLADIEKRKNATSMLSNISILVLHLFQILVLSSISVYIFYLS
ncbi:hypothetical protein [Glycocaulis alkaliphilus]|uniref:hypothetical protein n=1 Tax=Glycocaulis alkaliphilus TaxID=1434191 RepID=UPI000FD91658|nr:hypothetical protein [Glycocaulis alkaliphilus]